MPGNANALHAARMSLVVRRIDGVGNDEVSGHGYALKGVSREVAGVGLPGGQICLMRVFFGVGVGRGVGVGIGVGMGVGIFGRGVTFGVGVGLTLGDGFGVGVARAGINRSKRMGFMGSVARSHALVMNDGRGAVSIVVGCCRRWSKESPAPTPMRKTMTV